MMAGLQSSVFEFLNKFLDPQYPPEFHCSFMYVYKYAPVYDIHLLSPYFFILASFQAYFPFLKSSCRLRLSASILWSMWSDLEMR